ncbi:MAG: hypothetical protein P4M12_00280 [Gammaproteobacteria bacterium]|nr:hypothetical protein [Gammaproteobacteria bacterium]
MTGPKKNKLPKHLSHDDKTLFSLYSILPNIFVILIAVGAYLILLNNDVMPDKQIFFYWTMKIIIGFNVLAASARSFVAPGLTLIAGIAGLFTSMHYDITLITSANSWQLIILAGVGFVITISSRL